MALLYFANMSPRGAAPLMRQSYWGLQDFYQYLEGALRELRRSRPESGWSVAGEVYQLRPPREVQSPETWGARIKSLLANGRVEIVVKDRDGEQAVRPWNAVADTFIVQFAEELPDDAIFLLRAPDSPDRWVVVPERSDNRDSKLQTSPVWIEIVATDGDEGDRVTDAFLDEDVHAVYEIPDEETGEQPYSADRCISVLGRDHDRQALLLERAPASKRICVRPNTRVLEKQRDAVKNLEDRPHPAHRPLIRLLEPQMYATWESLLPATGLDWQVLKDASRPGTNEQREFVARALETPDFMLLEGPPGSGKTTAIHELVLQLVRRGQRVLLVGSTHVAVDNVIERLKDAGESHRDEILLVRIGDESRLTDKVREYALGRMAETELRELRERLERTQPRTRSQEIMLDTLRSGGREVVERILLDAAQVVCGTTIGILNHPEVKFSGAREPLFDVMIIDEASKTPFAEFLVPALLARRWIVVGDRRQLSPYVESAWMETNVRSALPSDAPPGLDDALLDVFQAQASQEPLLVVPQHAGLRDAYAKQGVAQVGSEFVVRLDAGTHDDVQLAAARLVIGRPEDFVPAMVDRLPLGAKRARGLEAALNEMQRRHRLLDDRERTWAGEITWRVIREYERRLLAELPHERPLEERWAKDINALMPATGVVTDAEDCHRRLQTVRRVALPSVLECLQQGCGVGHRGAADNALSQGLPNQTAVRPNVPDLITGEMLPDLLAPKTVLEERLVRLTYQHRMHPDISAFPRDAIYGGNALKDPKDMAVKRAWPHPYERYAARSIWIDVPDGREPGRAGRGIYNEREVEAVIRELKEFVRWAERNPREDGPWTVAVLPFYKAQERKLMDALRAWTRQSAGVRHFTAGTRGREEVSIDLCTVDRYQGHEADVVFLSLVRTARIGFLDSPNRLNVALTRARYQLVIVGKRSYFERRKHDLLGVLTKRIPSDLSY